MSVATNKARHIRMFRLQAAKHAREAILERLCPMRHFSPGDCFTACIATLSGIDRDELQNFHETYSAFGLSHEEAAPNFNLRTAAIAELARLGWYVQALNTAAGLVFPSGFAIASGDGPRGVGHSCVAYDGQIIFDPHPSHAGLDALWFYELVVPISDFFIDTDCDAPVTRDRPGLLRPAALKIGD